MTEHPPIPDAPNKPPWVKGYAEYGGQRIALIDHKEAGCMTPRAGFAAVFRYTVSTLGERESLNQFACVEELGRDEDLAATNDYAEALAEYHKQAELLRLAEEGT